MKKEYQHIPTATSGSTVRVPAAPLRVALAAILEAVDVPADDATLAADALVAGELRGVTTHGVANLAPRYVNWIEEGFINPRPDWRVTRGRGGMRNVDGDQGLGIVVAAQVMRSTIEIARETGIAMTVVHNSRHLGMAAYHAMLALEHGMIGVCTTAVSPRMVPTFGREPRLGTNPIALAAPAGEEPPFVFDAATTTVAGNKLRISSNRGEAVPPGLMVHEDGSPVREPAVPKEPFRLAPLGGTPEASSYKGYGLAAIVDILGLGLSQASFGGQMTLGRGGHTLLAIDVDAVLPLDEFRAGMDRFIRYLRETPTAPGHDEVLVAGDPQHRAQAVNEVEGIPLPEAAVDWIVRTGDRFGLDRPALEATPAGSR
jgi:L-2-hydroxycarboxylate dehydrogenase (NAD+)